MIYSYSLKIKKLKTIARPIQIKYGFKLQFSGQVGKMQVDEFSLMLIARKFCPKKAWLVVVQCWVECIKNLPGKKLIMAP